MIFSYRKPPIFTEGPVEDSPLPIEYPHGAASFIATGPPILPPGDAVVDAYPIGLAGIVSIEMIQQVINRPIIEMGSYHIHFTPGGVPIYRGMIMKVLSARTSLIKSLYSYYLRWDETLGRLTNELDPNKFPEGYMPDVNAIAPNSAGYFFNAYSSLLKFPFGLLIVYQNLVEQPRSAAVPGGPGITIMELYAERSYLEYFTPIARIEQGEVVLNQQASFYIGFLRALQVPDVPVFDDRKLMGIL